MRKVQKKGLIGYLHSISVFSPHVGVAAAYLPAQRFLCPLNMTVRKPRCDSATCGLKLQVLAKNILGGVKALRMSSFVTFSKLFDLSEPRFPHVKSGWVNVSSTVETKVPL